MSFPACLLMSNLQEFTKKENDPVRNKRVELEKTMTSDYIGNYRTVQSLVSEDYILSKYFIYDPNSILRIVITGISYGFSVFFMYIFKLPVLIYMIYKIEQSADVVPFIVCFIMISKSSSLLTASLSNSNNFTRANKVASKFIDIINEPSERQNEDDLVCDIDLNDTK
jgi:VIT1/CCC1 family predicted Fe2+/Mn2+ transporter